MARGLILGVRVNHWSTLGPLRLELVVDHWYVVSVGAWELAIRIRTHSLVLVQTVPDLTLHTVSQFLIGPTVSSA